MPARHGVLHHKAKLTEDQVREIRTRYPTSGFSMLELATMYDVTQHTIWLILTRKTWKHL